MNVSTARELDWLNGWPSNGMSVLMGTMVRCVGCGRFGGITTVAFEEGWEPPGPEPRWPFPEDDCPVCTLLREPARIIKDPCRVCGGTGERPHRKLP